LPENCNPYFNGGWKYHYNYVWNFNGNVTWSFINLSNGYFMLNPNVNEIFKTSNDFYIYYLGLVNTTFNPWGYTYGISHKNYNLKKLEYFYTLELIQYNIENIHFINDLITVDFCQNYLNKNTPQRWYMLSDNLIHNFNKKDDQSNDIFMDNFFFIKNLKYFYLDIINKTNKN